MLTSVVADVESSKKDMLTEIDELKEKIEYEKQPNIAFEKETEVLKSQVEKTLFLAAQIDKK